MRSNTFKGDTVDMNSHVFQYRSETTDPKQYSVTLEKLTHYVNMTFMSATDLDPIFKRVATPTITKPVKSEDDKNVVKMAIFNKDVKEYINRQNTLHDNIRNLYSVTWGQYSKPIRIKLIGLKQFESIDSNNDATSLLIEIKAIS